MADNTKRPPSKPVRRVRHDTRAEPDSAALPEPESIATLGRRNDSGPSSRRNPGAGAEPPPRQEVVDRIAPRRPRTGGALLGDAPTLEATGELASLRRQVATLQQELAQTQRRLANLQEERNEEADRLSELLARKARADGEARGSGPKLPDAKPSEPRIDDGAREQATLAKAALKQMERQLEERTAELAAAKADLDAERDTSQWLRAAGEQATREVAALRLRVTEPEMKAVNASEVTALTAEVARLTTEIETANDMRELAHGRETALRAELTVANARAIELAEELSRAKASATSEAEANTARLEEALAAARTEAATAAEAKLEEAIASAKAEAEKAIEARITEANAAAKAEGVIALDRMRAEHAKARLTEKKEHDEVLARERSEHTEKAKATDARIRALGDELTATMASMSSLQARHDSLTRAVEHAEARTSRVNAQLDEATAALATLMRSFEALEQTEERLEALRSSARESRASFADQTVALRVALSRASDAASAQRTAGSLAELEAVKSSSGDKAPRSP